MSKLYYLVCILFAYTASVNAKALQQKPGTAKPLAAAPKPAAKVTAQYVLKKDYDAQIQEMTGKISGAVNSTASLRRSVADKLEKVIVLDSQMQNVEKILNSASFQIALTSDSLKETRFSMEEFKKGTESNINELHSSNEELKNYLFIFFGASAGLTLILFIVMFMMTNSKLKNLKTAFQQQSKEFQILNVANKNAHKKVERY